MKKVVKIIGAAGAVALAASLVPYRFKSDKETGEFELGGLLWNLKKTAGEEEDTYTMELLPFVDKEKETEEAPAETGEAAAEEPVEEPFAEEPSNDVVVEEVDTAKEEAPAEEPVAEVEVVVDLDGEPEEASAEAEEEAPSAEDAQ